MTIRHGQVDISGIECVDIGKGGLSTTIVDLFGESPIVRLNASATSGQLEVSAKLQLLETDETSLYDQPYSGFELANTSTEDFHLGHYNNSATVNPQITIATDGKVGINTTSPAYKLDITGSTNTDNIIADGTMNSVAMTLPTSPNNINGTDNTKRFEFFNNYDTRVYGTNIDFQLGNGTSVMYLNDSGNVGIRTTNPQAKLDVVGQLRVNTNGDNYAVMGRTRVGQVGHTGWTGLAHVDHASANNYGFLTYNTNTLLNSIFNSRSIRFCANGYIRSVVLGRRGKIVSTYDVGVLQLFNNLNNPYFWQMSNDPPGEFAFFDNRNSWTGVRRGYIHSGYQVANIQFTGQHRSFIENIPYSHAEKYIGLIACANKNEYIDIDKTIKRGINAIEVNQALPYASLCRKEQDKTCYGVISGSEDNDNKQRRYTLGSFTTAIDKQPGDYRYYINSVGEGSMWVCNKNGNLESGDYITSASVPGYGQKQNDVILHNYTVAKITMDCDFNPVLQYKKQIRRVPVELTQDSSGNYFDASNNMVYGIDPKYRKLPVVDDDKPYQPDMIIMDDIYNLTVDEESRTIIEISQNVLDAYGELQWEDSEEQEYPYKIRYVDVDGNILTHEEYNNKKVAGEEVYTAAFVGVTYHCG
jgi:hypothetical protein